MNKKKTTVVISFSMMIMACLAQASYQKTATEIESFAQESLSTANDFFTTTAGTAQTYSASLDSLDQESKSSLSKSLATLLQLVTKVQQDTLKSLQDSHQKVTVDAQGIAQRVQGKELSADDAQKQLMEKYIVFKSFVKNLMDGAKNSLNPPLASIRVVLQQKADEAQRVKNTQTVAQLEKAWQEHQEKENLFFQKMILILPLLEQVVHDSDLFMVRYRFSGIFDAKALRALALRYQDIISKFSDVYKSSAKAVDFNDNANLATATVLKLINMYATDISISLKNAHDFLKKNNEASYLQSLYDLSLRLNGDKKTGTEGYLAHISMCANTFFTKNQDALIMFYRQKKKNMTLARYVEALQYSTLHFLNPTNEQLMYAFSFYNEILTNYSLLDDNQRLSLQKLINTNMGVLYTSQAQSVFKSMTSTSDNSVLRNKVLTSYQSAAEYFKKSGDDFSYQRAQTIVDSLKQAMDFQKKGKESEAANVAQALQYYQKAYNFFAVAGDSVSAQEVSIAINVLQSQQSIKDIKTVFENYGTKYRDQLQEYFITLSVPMVEKSVSSFQELYQAMIEAYEKALELCNAAIKQYDELNISTVSLKKALSVFSAGKQAATLLLQGDQIARGKDLASLTTSQENYYSLALNLFKKVDDDYRTDPFIQSLLKMYPTVFLTETLKNNNGSAQGWNLVSVAQRHIAKNFIEIANELTDNSMLAFQYYLAADGSRSEYLSSAVNQFLTTTLKSNQIAYDHSLQLFQQAQQKEIQAQQLTSHDWAAQEGDTYISTANNFWQEVIHGYFVSLSLSVSGALNAYAHALTEYADAYQKNVPTHYYPSSGAAMIYYKLYLLGKKFPEVSEKDIVSKKIAEAANLFFQEITNLLQASKAADLIKSSVQIEDDIVRWQKRFDSLLQEQQDALHELALPTDSAFVWKKNTNVATGDTTYLFTEPAENVNYSILIANADKTYALLYASIADTYFAQKNYAQAYQNYLIAKGYFDAISDKAQSERMNNLYNLAYTKSLVSAYRALIIPSEQDTHEIALVKVANVLIPEHYELYNYVQEIPSYIPVSLTIQELVKNGSSQATDAIQNTLINYAYLLYVDNQLKDHGIAYEDVFNGYDLRKDASITDDQKSLVVSFLDNANQFLKLLKARLTAQKTSLHLQARQDSSNRTLFFIVESYKPIPVFPLPSLPMTALPYSTFPTVIRYYQSARLLADPTKKIIELGGKSFVSANDQTTVDEMTNAMAKAYISAAYSYKQRVDFLTNGGMLSGVQDLVSLDELVLLAAAQKNIGILKKIDKKDMSVALSTYMPEYELLTMYVNDVIGTYYTQALGLYAELNDGAQQKIIEQIFGDLAVFLGDSAQLFLVGDPRAVEYFWGSNNVYGGILYDIKNSYLKAIAIYGKDSPHVPVLLTKAADLFKNAGDILVGQKNYFASIVYYAMALGAYKTIVPRNEKKVAESVITWLSSYYKGAIKNILPYREAKKNPLTLTLSNGTQEKISFDELLVRDQTGDPAEQELYQNYKNMLLDTLIYLSGCASAADSVAFPDTTASTQSPSNDQKQDDVTQLLELYTKKYSLSLDTLATISGFVISPNFEKTMLSIFDDIANVVLQADNKDKRAVGYAALGKLANTLFFAFGQMYMHDYLGGKKPEEQYIGLMQAIKSEEQAIIAPAEQWIE